MSVQNLLAFGRCWPNFGTLVAKKWLKMVRNGGFHPLSEKVFSQSNSNSNLSWCALVGWVFRTDLLLGHAGQIWPSSGQKIIRIVSKWWFPTIIWKSVHAIQFKLVVYTYYVSVQDWFALGPHWPNFCPLVAKNDWKWWFPTISLKSIHAMQFKLSVYTFGVNVQKWFAFGHVGQILSL